MSPKIVPYWTTWYMTKSKDTTKQYSEIEIRENTQEVKTHINLKKNLLKE